MYYVMQCSSSSCYSLLGYFMFYYPFNLSSIKTKYFIFSSSSMYIIIIVIHYSGDTTPKIFDRPNPVYFHVISNNNLHCHLLVNDYLL